MTVSAADLKTHLDGFIGTEGYHKTTLFPVLVTDGVLAMAEKAGAFWLIDLIGSHQNKKVRGVPFQVWTLDVSDDHAAVHAAVLTMKGDTGPGIPVKVEQKIPFTDFPAGSWKFYLQNGVLMLPSEW